MRVCAGNAGQHADMRKRTKQRFFMRVLSHRGGTTSTIRPADRWPSHARTSYIIAPTIYELFKGVVSAFVRQ